MLCALRGIPFAPSSSVSTSFHSCWTSSINPSLPVHPCQFALEFSAFLGRVGAFLASEHSSKTFRCFRFVLTFSLSSVVSTKLESSCYPSLIRSFYSKAWETLVSFGLAPLSFLVLTYFLGHQPRAGCSFCGQAKEAYESHEVSRNL